MCGGSKCYIILIIALYVIHYLFCHALLSKALEDERATLQQELAMTSKLKHTNKVMGLLCINYVV